VAVRRKFAISIPPGDKPGASTGEVSVVLSDGRTIRQPITWEVVPSVRVTPSALVHKQGEEQNYCLLVSAIEGRLNVSTVSGQAAPVEIRVEKQGEKSAKIWVKIPRDFATDRPLDIKLATGHPSQPEISFPIITLPGKGDVRDGSN